MISSHLEKKRGWLLTALVALGVLSASSEAAAQKLELVSVSGQYMPQTDFEPQPGKAQVASYNAALNVPLVLAPQFILVPGLGYHVDAISYSNTPANFDDVRSLHAVDASVMGIWIPSKEWSFTLRVSPGLAGDFKHLDSSMWRVTGLAMASHRFSDRFTLGGGGLVTYRFGTLLPLPAVYADWKPTNEFEIDGFLPAFVRARYTIGNRVSLGVLAEFDGNEYAIRDDRIHSKWPCSANATDDPSTPQNETVARPSQCVDNIAYSVGAAGLTADVRLFSSVWLTTMFGYSFFRRLDMRNSDGDTIERGEQDLPNVPVLRVGLVWRLPEKPPAENP